MKAIKSGEAIYNPAIMLRLKEIMLNEPQQEASNPPSGDAVEVEMKVGDGKDDPGMAIFKNQSGIRYMMTQEKLRLAAEGQLPETPDSEKKSAVMVEDAPIQPQAPSTRKPSPTDVTGHSEEAQTSATTPSKSDSPTSAPSFTATGTRPAPTTEPLKEDAPLQPQVPLVPAQKPPAAETAPEQVAETAPSPMEQDAPSLPEEKTTSEEQPPIEPREPIPHSPDEPDHIDIKQSGEPPVAEVPSKSAKKNTNKKRKAAEVETNQDDEPQEAKQAPSEDDLTPPPISPHPKRVNKTDTDANAPEVTPTETTETKPDSDHPAKRRKLRDTPTTPVRNKRANSKESADDLSPAPSTPATATKSTRQTTIEEESDAEVADTTTRARSRPARARSTRTRGAATTEDQKEARDEEPESSGGRVTRRQEMSRKGSTRNANKHDMSSPERPQAATKRSSRPSPERATRTATRGTRNRAKDKEGDATQESAAEESKPEESTATIRRSARQAKTASDAKDEDEGALDSSPEDAASPAATLDSEKKAKAGGDAKKQKNKEKPAGKKAVNEERGRRDRKS